jgi:hypothetical protein
MLATLPPVWLLALLAAGAAPFAVGAWQSALERRMRQRTLDVIARAGLSGRVSLAGHNDRERPS